MSNDHLNRVGGLVCTGYGAALIGLGIFVIRFDLTRGGLVPMTPFAAILGIVFMGSGIAALRGSRNWPAASLLGCLLVLAAIWRISHGTPLVFLSGVYAPIGFLFLVLPALIVGLSFVALARIR